MGVPLAHAKPAVADKPTGLQLGVPPPPPNQRSAEPPKPTPAEPPAKEEPKPEPPQQAAAEQPPAKPAPPESKLPPVETPAAPLSMQDFVRAAPPPPPQEILRPVPRVQPLPPPAIAAPPPPPTPPPTVQQHPAPQFAPSPLTHQPAAQEQQRAPADQQTAMVNPAEASARAKAADDYIWAVIRKFTQYLPDLRAKGEGGTVVVRMVIARDGRLLEVGIARSSGIPALDKGMVEALRAAAPYPPLPAILPGDHIVFTQPIGAVDTRH